MGTQKRRFVVERIKKAKKEKDPAGPDKDGFWHLLLIQEAPYIRA